MPPLMDTRRAAHGLERWSRAAEVLLDVLKLLVPELLPIVILLPVLLRDGEER